MNRLTTYCLFQVSLLLVCGFVNIGCGKSGPSEDAGGTSAAKSQQRTVPVVVVTSYPLYAMVSEIAGDAVEVVFPASEADVVREWSPTAADIKVLQSADLILNNGAGYEPWTKNLSLPRSRTIDTSTAYSQSLVRVQDNVTHQHGPKGAGSDTEVAWATWLDAELAKLQLQQTVKQLEKLLPAEADAIRGRASRLADRLERLSTVQKRIRKSQSLQTVFADARQFGNLITAMGATLKALSVAATEDYTSRAQAIRQIVDVGKADLVMLSAAEFAVLGDAPELSDFRVVPIDLCESEIPGSSFMDRLEHNIRTLEDSISVE